jgi:hypothetical protein
MRSLIVFNIAVEFAEEKGKTPLDLVLDTIRENLTPAVTEKVEDDNLIFSSPELYCSVTVGSPINNPDKRAITVLITQLPEGSLLMHKLMLLNKETNPSPLEGYQSLYKVHETNETDK